MKILDSKTTRPAILAATISILTLVAGGIRFAPDIFLHKTLKKASRIEIVFFKTDGGKETFFPIQSQIPSTISRLEKSIEIRKPKHWGTTFSGYLLFFAEDSLVSPKRISFSLNPVFHLVSFTFSGKTYQRTLSPEGRKLLARYLYSLKK